VYDEIAALKKSIKHTVNSELKIEVEFYEEECKRLRKILENEL
jgi:hypothetical protein